MRACHAAGLGPWSGQVSWVRFFLTCKTNVRELKAHKDPEHHLAIIIILIIIHHHFIIDANDLRCCRALKPKYTYNSEYLTS